MSRSFRPVIEQWGEPSSCFLAPEEVVDVLEVIAAQAGTDAEAGTVIEVVRPGYGDREHQLRPAQVVVAEAD